MRIKLLIILLFIASSTFSQDSIPVRSIDTLINFFNKKSIRLHGYENRIVPYNSRSPLYVLITYEGSQRKNFEYFRIDTSKYLVYEFFRSSNGSSNEGLKSSGIMVVTDSIIGKSETGLKGKRSYAKEVHYFKGWSKEGEWNEYEDSLFFHRYWTGKYQNNKRTGIWKNYIYDPNDDRLIQEIDYDRDSTKTIFTTNLIGEKTIDSLKHFLIGRWQICDAPEETRMLVSKCQLYDGHYGDGCNNRISEDGYFDFFSNSKFARHKGELCNNFKPNSASGNWNIVEAKQKIYLVIKLANSSVLNYHLLYLDKEGNMVADRQ